MDLHEYKMQMHRRLYSAEQSDDVEDGLDSVFSLLEIIGIEQWTLTTAEGCCWGGEWGSRIRALIARLPEDKREAYENRLEDIGPKTGEVWAQREREAATDNYGLGFDPFEPPEW